MSTSFEGYSPDGDAIAMASPECLAARQAFRDRLQELKKRQRDPKGRGGCRSLVGFDWFSLVGRISVNNSESLRVRIFC